MNATEIDKKIVDFEIRIRALEEEARNRHTHSTNACFEDSLAVLIDVVMSEQDQREYSKARLTQCLKILQEGRQGPHAYDPDRPAGERPKR